MRPKGEGVEGQAVGSGEVGSWVKVGNHLFESDRLLGLRWLNARPSENCTSAAGHSNRSEAISAKWARACSDALVYG